MEKRSGGIAGGIAGGPDPASGDSVPGAGRPERRGRGRGPDAVAEKAAAEKAPAAGTRTEPLYAALDLGTNNCRLLIARREGQGFEVIDAFSRAVQLGEGVEGSGLLTAEAQDRAIRALRICASKIRHHRAGAQRIVATEACRRARNGAEFVARARRETGLRIDVISAEEEARLAVAGCAPLVDPEAEQLLVFDIGGGSTELIWVDLSGTPAPLRPRLVRALAPQGRRREDSAAARAAAAHVSDWISVPVGVSTLHDRFASIEDDARRFAMMSWYFEERLAPFGPYAEADRMALGAGLQMVGVSGTATTFGALHLGLRRYDRNRVDGQWLAARAAAEVADRVLAMGREGRVAHPGIGRDRAELILSGAAILMTLLRVWPVERFRIADRGLREGMIYGLMAAHEEAGGRR